MFLAKWSIVFSGLGNVFELAKLRPGHRSCTIINVPGRPKRWLQHRAERLLMFSISHTVGSGIAHPKFPITWEHALDRILGNTLDRIQPAHPGGGERGRGELRPRTRHVPHEITSSQGFVKPRARLLLRPNSPLTSLPALAETSNLAASPSQH